MCASACVYAHIYAGTLGVQKRMPELLELQVQAFMKRPSMGLGN